MSQQPTFIERHGLWSDEQRRLAAEIKRRVEAEKLRYVRLAWSDTHGYARAKTLTVPAFLSALTGGYNIGVATTTLDSAGARVFASFTRGGGMGLDEMTGSPNLTVVADPTTFRMLPWAPGVGWILCDEYFNDGTPFHFAPRQLLRKALKKLGERGCASVIGAEIEWYLLRVAEDHLSEDNVGVPGTRGRPIKTWPVEPGYHYHSESNMDLMQPVFDALGDAFEALGLGAALHRERVGPGPGRMHLCAARGARSRRQRAAVSHRDAADLPPARLFRHLHGPSGAEGLLCQRLAPASVAGRCVERRQSVHAGKSRRECCRRSASRISPASCNTPCRARCSPRRPSTAIAASSRTRWRPIAPPGPTINRGAMIRVLGGAGDPATRLENRIGEPAANPYLFILSQVVAGLAGIDAELQPPPATDEPYAADRPLLPKSLPEALDALDKEPLFRRELGDTFIDYFLKLKRTEAGRYQRSLEESGEVAQNDEPSTWEQNEYFDFF